MKNLWSFVALILGALVIRIVSASLLYHTDVKNIYFESSYFNNGLKDAYSRSLTDNRSLPYPPAIYLLINSHKKINSWMFSANFDNWLKDGTARQTELHTGVFRDLLAMKFPMLVADLLIAFLLVLSVPQASKMLVASLWLLNPVTIYAVYGFGNFDVFPALALVAAFLCLDRKKWSLAYLLVGMASGLKLFAVILLPVLFLIDERKATEKLKGLAISLLTTLALFTPVFMSKTAFKSVFLSNLSGTLFKTQLNLADGHILPIFLVIYFVILAFLLSKKIKIGFVEGSFMVLGLLLGLSHFHPQWILWILPAVIWLSVKGKMSLVYAFVLLASFFGISLLINDKFVGLGLFKAINDAFDSIKPVRFYADVLGVGSQLQGLFQALFLASILAGIFETVALLKAKIFDLRASRVIVILALFWMVIVPGIFVAAHIPLIVYGRYIDVERMDQKDRIILDSKTVISQKVVPQHDNFSAILIRIKNIGLINQDDLRIDIKDSKGELLRSEVISGRVIGDDFDQITFFAPIAGSKNKELWVVLSQPNAKKEMELQIPYNAMEEEKGLMINGVDTKGSLAFTTYYNPGNLKDNLLWSLNNIKTKVF